MNKNEIKKFMYKEKPIAKLIEKKDGIYYYMTDSVKGFKFAFSVPESDMGDAVFKDEEPAQLLIRWINDGYGIEA